MSEHNTNSVNNGSVIVNVQYVKDLSFENPKAPYSLISPEQPSIDIGLDINAQLIHENMFEVVISVQAKASNKTDVIFIVELEYAGLFTLDEGDEQDREKILLVHCPNILFPYVRRIISDTVRDGGYPPLMIAPVDFLNLYAQRKKEKEISAN